MQKFLQWYKKSTKNKLIIFGIAFILALCYSFLHRPLGLIMWYNISFIEEKERIETLKNYMDNEKKVFRIL